jgi:hypothetical protein
VDVLLKKDKKDENNLKISNFALGITYRSYQGILFYNILFYLKHESSIFYSNG